MKRATSNEAKDKIFTREFGKSFSSRDCFRFGFSFFSGRHLILAAVLLFAAVNSFAQDEQSPPEDLAPPPLKIISKAEKSSLDAGAANVSDRTKLSVELMETRLKKAEDLYAQSLLPEMLDQLGGFHALMDDALKFLDKSGDARGKTLNNYKRLEISLRRFAPRIELIRRELPAKYEYYVRSLIKNLRAARSKAVEPFFDDSVVPNQKGNL